MVSSSVKSLCVVLCRICYSFFTHLLQNSLLFVSVAVDELTTLYLAYNEIGYNNHSGVATRVTFVFLLLFVIGTQRNANFSWYACHNIFSLTVNKLTKRSSLPVNQLSV